MRQLKDQVFGLVPPVPYTCPVGVALPVPVLAVCGFSGSGKTTLLERVIPELAALGLTVGVIKHDAHGVCVDQPGKDSDRLFRAGAQVLLRAPNETFARFHPEAEKDLAWALAQLAWQVDLILVEGHKDTALPRVWLQHPKNPEVPASVTQVLAVLPWGSDRELQLQSIVRDFCSARKPPLWGGILLGGRSQRMGTPKQRLQLAGQSLLVHLAQLLAPQVEGFAYLGAGPLPDDAPKAPQLPDPPGAAGPLAGVRAALRWHPTARWLVLPVDAVAVTAAFVTWLLQQHTLGTWLVQVENPEGALEPAFALVAPQMRPTVERLAEQGEGPRALAQHPKARRVQVPEELASALRTVNTPQEWERFLQETQKP